MASKPLVSGASILANVGDNDESELGSRRAARFDDARLANSIQVTDESGILGKSFNFTEHYSSCVKLSTENKINSKNAFGLHLIDFMHDIVQKKDNDFQIVGSTLDASAKIYAGRVDAVYTQTYKVLGGLGKELNPGGEDGEEEAPDAEAADGNEGGADDANQAKKADKKKKKRTCPIAQSDKTIEQDWSKVTANDAFLQIRRLNSLAAPENGTDYLAIHQLINLDNVLLLDSSTANPICDAKSRLAIHNPVSTDDDVGENVPVISSLKIDPDIAGFNFSDPIEATTIDEPRDRSAIFHYDQEADRSDASPIPSGGDDDSGEITDLVMNNEGAVIMLNDDAPLVNLKPAAEATAVADVGELMQMLASKPSDYSYFKPVIRADFRQQQPWTFRRLNDAAAVRPVANADGANVPPSGAKRGKKRPIRFKFASDSDDVIVENAKQAVQQSLQPNRITDGLKSAKSGSVRRTITIDLKSADSNFLPDQLRDTAQSFRRMMFKDFLIIARLPGVKLLKADNEQEAGVVEANEEMAPSSPPHGGFDDDDDDDLPPAADDVADLLAFDGAADNAPNAIAEENEDSQKDDDLTPRPTAPDADADAAGQGDPGVSMLAEPMGVEHICLKYAKQAKKINMRLLKETMWTLLQRSDWDKPLPTWIGDFYAKDTQGADAFNGKKPFSRLIFGLMEALGRKSGQTANELTTPLAFVTLLHLANEHQLKISNNHYMSDLFIQLDRGPARHSVPSEQTLANGDSMDFE